MPDNKYIAHTILDIIGGTPKVIKYWDNNQESKIDIIDVFDINRKSIM